MEENKTPEELQDTALDQVSGGVGTVIDDDSENEPLSLGNGSIPIPVLGEPRKREHYDRPNVKRKKKPESARKRRY